MKGRENHVDSLIPGPVWRQKRGWNGLCIVMAALVFLMSLPLALQCAPTEKPLGLSDAQRVWLDDHPTIRVAPDPFFPPIEYLDAQGVFKGISADYLERIEEILGVEFSIVHLSSWDEIIKAAKMHRVDMLSAAVCSPDRSKYLGFTAPYIAFKAVIITREKLREKEAFLDMDHLQGMKVCVVKNYVWQEYIERDYPEMQLDPVPNLEDGLIKVSMGLSDAMIAGLPIAVFYIQKAGITNLCVAGNTDYVMKLSFATRKDWPELKTIMQKALDRITPQERRSIMDKWVHIERIQEISDRRFSGIVLVSLMQLAFLFTLVLVWVFSFRRMPRFYPEDRHSYRVIFFAGVTFALLGIMVWLDEIIDIPERLLGASMTSVNIQEAIFETVLIYLLGIMVIKRLMQDLQVRRASFRAISEGEQRYRAVFENTGTASMIIEADTTISMVNTRFEEMSGYTREEIEDRLSWTVFVADQDLERMKAFHYARRGNSPDALSDAPGEYAFTFIDRKGGTKDIFLDIGMIPGTKKSVASLLDVTQRRRSEEALKESEEKFRALVQSTPTAILLYQGDMFIYANPAAQWITGYTEDELKAMVYWEIVHPDYQDLIRARVHKRQEGNPLRQGYEFRIIRKDGVERWVDLSGATTMIGGSVAGIVSVIDITQRKQAEAALLRRLKIEEMMAAIAARFVGMNNKDKAINTSLAELGEMFDADRAYLFIFSEDGITMDNTHEWCRYGVSPHIDSLKDLSCAMFPWWIKEIQDKGMVYIEDLSELPTEASYEREIFEARGIRFIVALPVNIGKDLGGFVGLDNVRDAEQWKDEGFSPLKVTCAIIGSAIESHRAGKALIESEQRYRTVFDASSSAMLIIKEDMEILFANSAFEWLSGLTGQELESGRTFLEFVSERDQKKVSAHIVAAPGPEIKGMEFGFIDHSGIVKDVLLSSALLSGTQRHVLSIIDITELKRMGNRLEHAQRLESLGTLAGGIAHDFNNLLAVVMGNASLLLAMTDPDDPQYKRLIHIEHSAQRGADLTKQILGFAQKGKYEVKTIGMNALIENSLDMFAHTRKDISIHIQAQDDLWWTKADVSQMEQVLLNIYVNAGHAMPAGGRLYVETRNVILDNAFVWPYEAAPGRYIRISVTDTGEGMDDAVKDRVFEPFFTTREMGAGAGLGLASVYGIVHNHNGFIYVHSEKTKGSTFTIHLPASEEAPVAGKAKEDEAVHGTGTILLVDDEGLVLDTCAEMVRSLGYKALLARSGQEAIDIFSKDPGAIDLVILDMIMPEKGGGETFDEIKAIKTDVRVILCSGYSMDSQASSIIERGCVGFIQKPFSIMKLSRELATNI